MSYEQITTGAIIFLSITSLVSLWLFVYFYLQARHHTKLVTSVKQASPQMMSKETQIKLEQAVQSNFQTLLEQASHSFNEDLKGTSQKLNEEVSRLTTGVITNELEQYRTVLSGVREQASKTVQEIQTAVDQQRQAAQQQYQQQQLESRTKLDAYMGAERDRLLAELDKRLADIVASYLSEALGENVDLGAQSAYLVKMLEQNKEEFKKDLSFGA